MENPFEEIKVETVVEKQPSQSRSKQKSEFNNDCFGKYKESFKKHPAKCRSCNEAQKCKKV